MSEAASDPLTDPAEPISGHGGQLAAAALRAHGVETMWTLSGAHVFPLYDAAVKPGPGGEPPLRLVDVRHEQTAVFAAEATAKLTRAPGLAVLTAGPGITNGVSAIASAHLNGSPLLVLGGRAPTFRWGTGALQELDHPPIVAPITKHAGTIAAAADIAGHVDEALRLAAQPHRGPVFLDMPVDQLYSHAESPAPTGPDTRRLKPEPGDLDEIAELLGAAERPVLVLSSDVWMDGADGAALAFAEAAGLAVITTGMGRGILPAGHPLLVTRARALAFGQADLVLVAGAPLDFRLGYGAFGGRDGAPAARVVHLADSPAQVAGHVDLAASAAGCLRTVFEGLLAAFDQLVRRPVWTPWVDLLRAGAATAIAADQPMLTADGDRIHPARIYGELNRLLDDDTVVIGDGGDFVSFAGRFVEPRRPGRWLDPGPYGCLGTGLGYAAAARVAHPSAPIALLLGDGAAGFSLMDADTLVRHDLPVVMIVGNNGIWGLEKHPMRFLYGYDVAADLRQASRYDEVVRALGGAGETVERPADLAAALGRAFASGVPYLVNVLTDPDVAYPRTTTGV
jgi:acetolactate synthase-1/2/3 large subunit